MKDLPADAILFNFECCSDCEPDNYHFPQRVDTISMISFLLERGNMVMCSDFAVKALINDWSEKELGPNPFIKLGECNDYLELFFLPKTLQESPSKQLQMVGQLCETGKATIHALGGTVVFGVKKAKDYNEKYSLSILTIATRCGNFDVESRKENL